jgi:hypothetical protein
MVRLSVEINDSGEKSHFARTIGEEMASDLGQVTVALRKTVQTQPYHSTTLGVEVTLPVDYQDRQEALRGVETTYETTLIHVQEFLKDLEAKVL